MQRSPFVPVFLLPTATLLVAATVLLTASPAHAQLSAAQLVAPAVKDFGPQYQDVEKAVESFRRGKADEARRLLETARKKNPHLAPADVMLAQLMFSAGQLPATRALLEKTAVDLPEDPETFIIIGDLALREGRLTEATTMFAKGLALCQAYDANPLRKASMMSNAYAGLATIAEARKDWAEASKQLQAWIAADEKNARAHLRLGQALFRQKKYDDATASFTKAHELDAKVARAEVNMALMLEQADEHDAAAKWMASAAKLGENELETRLAAARWALDTGDLAMAKTNVAAALKIEPNSLPANLLQGLVARHEGDDAAAIKAFEAALALSPNNVGAINQLAQLLIESDVHKEQIRALGYAHLNAQINGDANSQAGREAAVTLTWVLHKLGHDDPAVRRLQAILEAGSVSAESAFHAARIYADLGQKQAAAVLLQRALAQNNSFPGRGDAEALLTQLKEEAAATASNGK
ncbi:MAG: tetratricopeptide repeat protein [Pirellulaceae bacterium]